MSGFAQEEPSLLETPAGEMMIDHDNAVVKLCAKGTQAEQEGDGEAARVLFLVAWDQCETPLERAIAAHYVARHQKSLKEVLHWNQTALDNALAVVADEAQELLPSLNLNLGRSHEDTGSQESAQQYYRNALETLQWLPESGYRDLIQNSATAGLERLGILARYDSIPAIRKRQL